MGDQSSSSLRLLTLIQLFFWLRVGVVDPILVLYIRRTGVTVTEIGLVMMANSVGWAIFEPIFGVVANRLGKKRLMLYSVAATSLIYVSYVFATNILHFYLIMFAMSANMAAGLVPIRALMMELLPATGRGKAYGRYSAIMSLGQIVGPLAGGFIADTVGYVAPFYISGVIGAVCLAIILQFKYAEKPKSTASPIVEADTVNRSRLMSGSFLGLLAMRLLYMFNMNFQRTTLPIFLYESQSLRATETEIGLYMGALRLTSALSQPLLGVLADKVGDGKLITAGLALSGISYISLNYISGVYLLYPLGMLQGVFFAATDMSMMLRLTMITPMESSSKAVGVYGLAEDVGGMVASPALNAVYDGAGPSFSILFVSAALLFNALASVALAKLNRKDKGEGWLRSRGRMAVGSGG